MTRIGIVFILILSLTGCATPIAKEAQIEELRMRIATLERELQTKDKEIRALEEELYEKGIKERREQKKISRPTPRRIQRALMNAGFFKGPINGKIGPQTKRAIKEFQKAHGLKADGIVGKRTWEKLSKYLD